MTAKYPSNFSTGARMDTRITTMDDISELNRQLDEHSKELLHCSMEYPRLAADAVTKRNVYDVAKARAALKVRIECPDYKVDAQKAEILLRCEPQMIDARIAEAHQDSMKQRLKSLADSLSAVQTKARLLKTESDLNGYRT